MFPLLSLYTLVKSYTCKNTRTIESFYMLHKFQVRLRYISTNKYEKIRVIMYSHRSLYVKIYNQVNYETTNA